MQLFLFTGSVVLERLAQRIQMEVTGFFVTEKTQSKLRDQLKTVRALYYNTIVAVLNPENTKYLLDQVGLSLLSLSTTTQLWLFSTLKTQSTS